MSLVSVNKGLACPRWIIIVALFYLILLHDYCTSIFLASHTNYLWPLTRKRSLLFAVLKQIAVCMLFISCSNSLGIHSNGSSYPFKKSCQRLDKIVSCSNGSGYLSIQKKKKTAIRMAWAIHSKKIFDRSSAWSYLFNEKF